MSQHRAPEPRFRRLAIGVFAGAIAVIASTGVVYAAGTSASVTCTRTATTLTCPDPQATVTQTVPGPTVTATVTVPASPSASTSTPSPTPTPTSSAPAAGFPDATNTGPLGQLTHHSGDLTVAAGQVVTNLDIDGEVTLGSGAALVNSLVRCEGSPDFCVTMGTGSTLTQDSIGGGADGKTRTTAIGVWTGGPGNVIQASEVHLTSDGLRIDGGTTIVDSFIHDLDISGHSDGAQNDATGGQPNVFEHDTIWGGTNDAVFNDQYATADLTVDNCLIVPDQTGSNQSSYGVYSYRPEPKVIVTNNVFKHGWQKVPIELVHGGLVQGNRYDDGSPVT